MTCQWYIFQSAKKPLQPLYLELPEQSKWPPSLLMHILFSRCRKSQSFVQTYFNKVYDIATYNFFTFVTPFRKAEITENKHCWHGQLRPKRHSASHDKQTKVYNKKAKTKSLYRNPILAKDGIILEVYQGNKNKQDLIQCTQNPPVTFETDDKHLPDTINSYNSKKIWLCHSRPNSTEILYKIYF